MTLRECIDIYLAHLKVRVDARDLTKARLELAERYLRLFAARFGSKGLGEAKRHDLTVFIEEHPSWQSGWTKQNAVGAVITCFRWLEENELIPYAPYRKPRSMKLILRPRRPMAKEDYVAIMRAAMHRTGDKWTAASEPRLVKLRHPPYRTPICQLDDVFTCAIFGPVRVDGLTDGLIRWPYTQQRGERSQRGPKHLIVCGDLLKALRQEEAAAISHWWGISTQTIYSWRRALGIRGLVKHQRRYRRLQRMSRASGHALRRFLFFLARTGARTSEVRAMRWDDIDFENRSVRLLENKTGRVTNGEVRFFGLGLAGMPGAFRLLCNLKRRVGDVPGTDHVFLNGRGKPWTKSSFTSLVRKYARRAGLMGRISAYSLRHLFVCRGLERGVGERQIADQLGHRTTKQLDTYAREMRLNSPYLSEVVSKTLGRKVG